ncbi:MAG: serine/threonine protein kinase, partial [Myxococcales bacterium]
MSSASVRPADCPERVGRYEVVLPLASGGMATVYLARSYGAGGVGREVALKLMHAHLRDAPEFAQSLLDEARLMVSIRHPNVVSVLDVGDDPRGLFLVMDLIEGDTVGGLQKRARLDGRPVPPPVKARLLLDALAGLHAAHESRAEDGSSHFLIHRDFSPQNLLVGLDGVTRLTDFGVARAATQLQRTQTGLVKGKASYMAPEQARGLPLDRRCDVWAAGVVAWELLADRRLFRADNDVATVVRVLSETAPRLDDVVGAPGAVADAVERALQPELDARWPTAAAFRQALLEAFRADSGVAEHEEVAGFVTALLGERLAARREQAATVLRERRRPAGVEREGLPEPASG